jgi:hypothetical protein
MSDALQPYGIHHCGNNVHRVVEAYAEIPLKFLDVGWGSDIAHCQNVLPNTFLNLRLSPIRMLQCTPAEVAADAEHLLQHVQSLEKVGICCVNMDYGTPDENIYAVHDVVRRYRKNR